MDEAAMSSSQKRVIAILGSDFSIRSNHKKDGSGANLAMARRPMNYRLGLVSDSKALPGTLLIEEPASEPIEQRTR